MDASYDESKLGEIDCLRLKITLVAMTRIKDGNYGIRARCGEKIPEKRLAGTAVCDDLCELCRVKNSWGWPNSLANKHNLKAVRGFYYTRHCFMTHWFADTISST